MTDAVIDGIFAVDEGDAVSIAIDDYSWTNPMEVTDVDHVEWDGADGDTWATREVGVKGGYGSTFTARCVSDQDDGVQLRKDSGAVRGVLEQFEIVDVDDADDEDGEDDDDQDGDVYCGICGYGPSTDAGIARHHGLQGDHDGDVDQIDPAEHRERFGDSDDTATADDKSEDNQETASNTVDCNGRQESGVDADTSGDEADGDAGDEEDNVDLDDELSSATVHSDEIVDTLEVASGEADEDDADDEGQLRLPDGVTVDDVHDAVDKHEYLVDVAEELDLPSQQVRSILVNVDRYADISEASRYRGGVRR